MEETDLKESINLVKKYNKMTPKERDQIKRQRFYAMVTFARKHNSLYAKLYENLGVNFFMRDVPYVERDFLLSNKDIWQSDEVIPSFIPQAINTVRSFTFASDYRRFLLHGSRYVIISSSDGAVPLTMIFSLGLAVVLNQKVKGRGIFRTLSFFPYVGSLVAVTAVWKMLFHPSKGPINALLYYVFKVPQDQLPQWFSGSLVLLSLILFSVWKYMGYYMVIYLAGLQNISPDLYEAASLDGAGTWDRFKYITWPQLRATTFFVVVMLTINCFKIYDIAIMLAGGGSGELTTSATVLVYYIYQKAFIDWDLGYSSAVAMVLFLIVLVVTIIQFAGEHIREQ